MNNANLPHPDRRREGNPAVMVFANDVLCWEPFHWLTDAQMGQVFRMLIYGCKLGGTLPRDHPLLAQIDAKLIELCTRPDGDGVAIVQPLDLPKLLADRQEYLDARRAAGSKGGRVTARQRRRHRG